MIYLDDKADTCPDGLRGTPFWEVYRTLRQVAVAGVWPVDPGEYRAGMAWGWYALHKPGYLTNFRNVVQAALVSACAPMIKATQTNAELVEYLRQWRGYRPTFPQLQSLYSLFGAVVDVQPISDPESQAVLPVDNTRLAFYLRVESIDPERPLSLSDAITIAERATPMGSRPYAYRVQESRITVPVALAPSGVTLWVENDTVASAPALPTVSYADFGGSSWLRVSTVGSYVDVAPNDQTSNLTSNNVDYPEYDSTKSYGIVQWQKISGTIAGRVEFAIVESSGKFQAKNVTSNTLSFYQAHIAVCSSPNATVITVYDNSNNPYNAFKYTLNDTDYYYVLDGTQTDWTDDLSGIGYHVPGPPVQVFTAYFTSDGASATGDTTVSNGITYRLRDANGNLIPMDNTKAYLYAGSYTYNGDPTYVPPGYDPAKLWYFPYAVNLSCLNIRPNGDKTVFRFEYTEKPLVNAWFASDKSSVTFSAGKTKVLYDDDGNQIKFDFHSVYVIYLWRTSEELTTRYITFYKLRCDRSYLVCTNTNNVGYSGPRGLQFYNTLQVQIGYLRADKSPISGPATSMQLYDEDGNAITFESGKTYKIHDVFNKYEDSIDPGYLGYWSLIDSSGMLYWKSDQYLSGILFIQYTVS